jgi:hypothetical protein
MAEGIFALYGVTSRRSSLQLIESFSRTFHMPFVTPTYPPPPRLPSDINAAVAAPSSGSSSAAVSNAGQSRHWSLSAASLPSGHVERSPTAGGFPTGAGQASATAAGGLRDLRGPMSLPMSSAFTIYMRPIYRPAIVDLVRHYGWTRIYYIYDSPEGKPPPTPTPTPPPPPLLTRLQLQLLQRPLFFCFCDGSTSRGIKSQLTACNLQMRLPFVVFTRSRDSGAALMQRVSAGG